MLNLTNIEKETQINWNNEEKTAEVYTYDSRIIRLLDKYNVDYKREESGLVVANIPKTWVKIRAPREMSDEERQKLAERAKARFCK